VLDDAAVRHHDFHRPLNRSIGDQVTLRRADADELPALE
jgi:hypothetical protein